MSRDSSPQKNLRLDTFNIVALAVLSSLRFFSVPVVTQSKNSQYCYISN